MSRGGPITKLLGAGIGLASEAIHHSREKKRAAREGESLSQHSRSASASGSNTPAGLSPAASRSISYNDDEAGRQGSGSSSSHHQPTVAGPSTGRYAHDDLSVAPPSYADATDDEPTKGAAYGRDEKAPLEGESDHDHIDDDEAIWELDDMAERVDPPAYAEVEEGADVKRSGSGGGSGSSSREESPEGGGARSASPRSKEDAEQKKQARMVRELVRLAGPAPTPAPRLPCPVILPQRRPRNKSRGFVRAYAPVLEGSGVGQDVFLRFLKDWHQASKASPWIDVVFVAAGIVGFVPEMGAQIASAVVQVAAGTARELQSRHRNNSFLDRANQELFMPRGLFAMVMSFKDELPGQAAQGSGLLGGLASAVGQTLVSSERLNIDQTAAKYSSQLAGAGAGAAAADPSRFKKTMQNIRTSSGKTYTQLELPEAAPLIYPDLDRAVEHDLAVQEGEGGGAASDREKATIKTKWRSAGKFVQDYLDRRAQAEYEGEHLGSSVAVPSSGRKPFYSRYADPNHPANSGSLIALLTGGAITRDKMADSRQRVLGGGGRSGYGSPGYGSPSYGGQYGNQYGRSDQYYDDNGYGYGYGGYGRRRGRRERRPGLITGLVSLAVDSVQQQRQQSQLRKEQQQQQQEEEQQRSNAPAPHAPYGGSSEDKQQYASSSSNAPAPPAPYGGTSPQPYGPSPPPQQPYGQQQYGYGRRNRRQRGGLRKMLQQDVLYLLIVNLPTDAEVEQAAAQLKQTLGRRQ